MFELKTRPGAIIVAEESVGIFLVGELQVDWVPEQLAERQVVPELNAQGHVAQQDGLGQRSGPIEIGTSRLAPFAGRDPLLVVVGRTGNGLRNPVGLVGARRRIDLIAEDETVVADERSEEHTSEL